MKLKFGNKLIPQPVKVDNTELDPFLKKYLAGEEQRITEMANDLLQNPEQYGYTQEAIKEHINDPIGFNYDFGYAMGQNTDTREGNVNMFREFVRQNASDPNFADAFEDDYVSEAIENFHKELYNKTRKK